MSSGGETGGWGARETTNINWIPGNGRVGCVIGFLLYILPQQEMPGNSYVQDKDTVGTVPGPRNTRSVLEHFR